MAPRVDKTSKIALLKLILAKKSVLFGKFSSDLDNRAKQLAWTEVLIKAKSLQIVTGDRDVSFVRDKVYGVWKSRTLEKRDNRKQTGGEGGREKILDEVDKIILDIVGKASVAMDGLPIGESGVIATSPLDLESEDDEERVVFRQPRTSLDDTSSTSIAPTPLDRTRGKKQKSRTAISEDEVKRRYIQCQLMDIKVYKHRLECLKLERDLNLPPSSFTIPLFEGQNQEGQDD